MRRTIRISVLELETTGLLVARSEDLPGLYIHARDEKELLKRIPQAIRALLEARGEQVEWIAEVNELPAGFVTRDRKYEARIAA